MKTFSFTSQVERTVIDTISLEVKAATETEAYEIAEQFLNDYPEPADGENVKYCFIEHREPREIKILTIDRSEDAPTS